MVCVSFLGIFLCLIHNSVGILDYDVVRTSVDLVVVDLLLV